MIQMPLDDFTIHLYITVIAVALLNIIGVAISRFAKKSVNVELFIAITYFLQILCWTVFIVIEKSVFSFNGGMSILLYFVFLVLYSFGFYRVYTHTKKWIIKRNSTS
jgi:hypothetical protein